MNLELDEEKQKFIQMVEGIILRNETRLKSVKISIPEGAGTPDRTFRFRIDGVLRVEPAVKPVVFDSAMEPVTRAFKVKDVESG